MAATERHSDHTADFGQGCGLTNVHVNRVLRELREAQLCDFRDSRMRMRMRMRILDLKGPVKKAYFDPAHLHLAPTVAAWAAGHPGVFAWLAKPHSSHSACCQSTRRRSLAPFVKD